MTIWAILLVICMVICLCWWLNRDRLREAFTVPAKDINSAIIFACYRIDSYDYEFIKKWHKTATFYVVVNGDPTDWDQKVKSLDGVRYMLRENEGYDTTAWKVAMERWREELNAYDSVVLANNSCIYAIDLIDVLTKADGYDMYGLYAHSKTMNPLDLNITAGRFLHTYFIVVGRDLYNSDDFKEYWDGMPRIRNHTDACIKHENRFSKHFDKLGYRIGVYMYVVQPEWVYDEDPRSVDAKYRREFVKRKANDEYIKRFVETVYREKGEQ